MTTPKFPSSAALGFVFLVGLAWPGALARAQVTRVYGQMAGGVDVVPNQTLFHPSFATLSANGLFTESNLATGEIKASSADTGPDSALVAAAYAGMEIYDLTIVAPAGAAPVTIPLTMKVTGVFTRSVGVFTGLGPMPYIGQTTNLILSAGQAFSAPTTIATYAWEYAQGSTGAPPTFKTQPTTLGGSSVIVTTGTPAAIDVTLTVNLTPGVKYFIQATVLTTAVEAGDSSALTDLSHTAKLSLSLPAGYSHTSNGGIFLSAPPAIATQPADVTVSAGSAATFTVGASGQPAPTYQWRKDGVAIAGATGASFNLPSAQPADVGGYSVVATNTLGSATSRTAALVVTPPPNPGRLINLSIRSAAGTGAQTLIAGAVIGGAGTGGAKPLLIRAAGPALGPFGVTGFLADPTLSVFSGTGAVVAANDNWAGDAQVIAIGGQVGAFALAPATSRDAALHAPALNSGTYTVQVSGVGGITGIALAEIYDATPVAAYTLTTPRLINLSARTQVGTGGDILIAGFVIGGATPKTLLIRAVGPTLTAFGVPGALADPRLELYAGTTRIDLNDNWGGAAPLAAAFGTVGAFALAPASLDAALLVTLAPGNYTAQISGVGGATGVALVEVYEVP